MQTKMKLKVCIKRESNVNKLLEWKCRRPEQKYIVTL